MPLVFFGRISPFAHISAIRYFRGYHGRQQRDALLRWPPVSRLSLGPNFFCRLNNGRQSNTVSLHTLIFTLDGVRCRGHCRSRHIMADINTRPCTMKPFGSTCLAYLFSDSSHCTATRQATGTTDSYTKSDTENDTRAHTHTGLQWNVGDVNAASTRSFLPFLLTSLFHAAPFTVWRPPHEWRHLLDRQLTYYQPDVASGNAAFPNLNTQKGDMEVQCRHFIGLFSSNDVIFVQWMLWIYTAPGHIYSSYLSLSAMDAHDGTETQYPHLIGFFFYNDVIFNQRNLWTHVAPVRADFKMGACDGGETL